MAAVQFEPVLGAATVNLGRIVDLAAEAASQGAEVVLFPECALQGYVFESRDDALGVAARVDGAACVELIATSRDLKVALVCGFLELTEADRYANSVLIATPCREAVVYRKAHLPMLGADRWARPGDRAASWFEFRGVRLGVQICYDLRFPEPTRILALSGVDVILLATNWPRGYEASADHAARTRAWENRCWLLAANRIGREAGTRFIGRSLAVEPWGTIVAQASADAEELLFIDVDPEVARSKLLPGHANDEYDFFAARRPELYEDRSRVAWPRS